MNPLYNVITAGLLCMAAPLAAAPYRSASVAGMLLLVIPATALVQVLLTVHRFCGAAR